MKLRNNGKNTWLQYNCGNEYFIDILPESEFEVDDKVGMYLLRVLGGDTWLIQLPEETLVEEPKVLEFEEKEKEEKVEEPLAEPEEEEVVVEEEEEEDEPLTTLQGKRVPICAYCDTTNKRYHKAACTRPKGKELCVYCGATDGRHKLLCKRPKKGKK